jgi:TPP-dependent pyruvate/acetoin dehydrogenase alpha subunit
MTSKWNIASLQQFEARVADAFNQGQIRAPIHLSDGNEENLIEIFQKVRMDDWVLCSWRSHYQCLLKGVPEDEVFKEIIDGNSITLAFPEYRVFSSAIVAGMLPIAVGLAMREKKSVVPNHVWCFIGDMTSETGMAQTCFRYSEAHSLPITFVIEDNGVSTVTKTREVWNSDTLRYEEIRYPNVISFKYKSKYPHSGAGKRVEF